jgi:flagellar protein FlaF
MSQENLATYQMVQHLAVIPSQAEAQALTKAAMLLDRARDTVDDDYGAYATALTFNQILWTILQADLSGEDNRLPDNLRDDLLLLSLFVDRQTILALGDPNPKYLDALIEINRNLAQGLGHQGGNQGTVSTH